MAKHIPWLFLGPDELNREILEEDNFRHLINVLRMGINDLFIALDNHGNKYQCRITELKKKNAAFEIISSTYSAEPSFRIILAQAITKAEAFEEILNKAVQLGVSEIIPLITDNTVFPLSMYRKKEERFRKIIRSASEQSQRLYLPVLSEVLELSDFINRIPTEELLIASEKSDIPLKNVLRNYQKKQIYLLCGPEGGFSEKEAVFFQKNNFNSVSLSKNILRSETAVICGLSNIVYELSL